MGEMVEFPSNGTTAGGYLAIPDSGSGPGVLVVQEWWGLNDQIKGVCDRLAGDGYVALAPDLYHGELAGHDEMDKAGRLMEQLPADRAARDMQGAIDHLLGHDAVGSTQLGVVGFCMGGLLTLVIAARAGDKVAAAAPFYGFPQGDDQPEWSTLTAKVEGHMAGNDDFFPPDAARELEARLRDMGKDVTFHVYEGAGHAFANEQDSLGTHDPEAAATAWARTMALFQAELT